MAMNRLRVVHYLNQFFAGSGGEDKAGEGPRSRDGVVGPGQVLQRCLGDEAEVVATVSCGDNFFSEHEDEAVGSIVELIRGYGADLLGAGPAFDAGGYGVACGRICQAVQETLGLPAVTGMYPENPAVELYRQRVHIVASGPSATSMPATVQRMASLGIKLARGAQVGVP